MEVISNNNVTCGYTMYGTLHCSKYSLAPIGILCKCIEANT